MKTLPVVVLTFLCSFQLNAQDTYFIKGSISDTLNNPLIMATVLLLEETDSTMIDYGRTEMDGSFKFKNVKNGSYLVKSTYLGYLPISQPVKVSNENIVLDTLKMKEIATELMEVVVKEAKASIKMKGDTIEYDASTFQVPEGSTVEDLLRRLPGVDLEQDGSITSDGKNVNRVLVDGKSFFGSDTKAATKNLPAESISKVQIFDTKTEEEETTGLSSSSADKTMNLELKEGFKKGGFGKVVGGIGTVVGRIDVKDRAELKGNYNKFNEKIQFSFVGVGNNTGRNGLSRNGYRDFMGSQFFNFDSGFEYGFGGGGYYRTITFGGGNDIESSIQSLFFTGSGGGGFPKSYNGGFNFNYDHEKNKLSAVYYYNHAGLERIQITERQEFYDGFSLNRSSSQEWITASNGHRAELNYIHEFDSLHTVKLFFNAAAIDETTQNNGVDTLFEDQQFKTASLYNNFTERDGYLGKGTLLFNKKFKKKGRRFGVNSTYLYSQLNDDIDQQSTLINDQMINNFAEKKQWKVNTVYVEPLNNKLFLQTFYNYSNRRDPLNREVYDVNKDEQTLNNNLSRNFENIIIRNRVGTTVRYSYEGVNASLGLAYQAFNYKAIGKKYENIISNVQVDVSPNRSLYLRLSYYRNAQEPNIDDLQPIVNNSDPLFIRNGNPVLLPEIVNDFGFTINKNWIAQAVRVNFGASYSIYEDQFSTQQNLDTVGVITTMPVNINGNTGGNFRTSLSFPIIKNKITVRTNARFRNSNRIAIVNDVENITHTNVISGSCRLSITPNPNIGLYINANTSFTNTAFDIDENQRENQKIRNTNLDVEFNTKLVAGFFLNSSFDNSWFINRQNAFNENIPLLNISLYRQFLKKKQIEARISLYDAFNQDRAISQNTYKNVVSRSQTAAIGRYIMFNLTYNIQGLKDDIHKNG